MIVRLLLAGLLLAAPLWAQEFEQVNTTSPQTLENKTLTSPSLAAPSISGTVTGTPTIPGATLPNPTITGTVGGGASYTGPTVTSPTVTGTVAGGATYSGPTLTNPTITGTVAGSPTITSPTINSPTIATPTISGATATVPKQFSADLVTPENYSSSLATTVSTIGATPKHVAVLQNYTVSANLTFPATMAVSMQGSGGITCSTAAVVITFNGPFSADLRKVFTLSGGCKVLFGVGSVPALYPHWWGVKGDDSTADGAIIQDILSNLAAGTNILFPCGTYRTSAAITIAAITNQNLTGSGSCTIIKNVTSNDGIFSVTAGANNLQISNMKLLGTGTLSTLGRGLIYVNPAGAATPTTGASFHDLWLAAPSTSGISGNCLTDSKIQNNFFYNDGSAYGEHGLYLSNAGCVTARVKVTGNYLYNTASGNSAGVTIRQWQDSDITGNTVIGWKYGILPVSDTAGPPFDIRITGNHLIGQSTDALNFFRDSGSTAPTKIAVDGNTMTRAGRNGIRSDFVTDCKISNNHIFENVASGMRFNEMARCKVNDNLLRDNDSDSNGADGDDSSGIRLNATNTDNQFTGNTSNVSNVLSFQKYGISIGSSGNTGNSFTTNTFFPNRTADRDVGATTNYWLNMSSTGAWSVGKVDNALIGLPDDRGTCTFSAATSKVCSLTATQPDNVYYIVATCNADKNFWVNTKTTTTFTLNADSSSSDNCDWVLMR